MARYSCALVLLASSTTLAHVYSRQAISSNVTTVVVPPQTSTTPPSSIPLPETPGTSAGNVTETAHTERPATSLDFPTSVSETTTVTQTSFDRPPVPTGGTFTTQLTARTQITQTTLDHPGTPSISWITWDSSIHITLPAPQTQPSQATLDVPIIPESTASKVVAQKPAATLDVPQGPPNTVDQPGTAIPIEKPGQSNDVPRPGGASEKPEDEDGQSSPGGNEGQPGNGKPGENQGGQGAQNSARPTPGDVGGLISAIRSVATKQAVAAQNGQNDDPIRPVGVVTTAAPDVKPSVTGFVIGTHTASPGGSAFTQGGSTFSALPSGAGLQVIANGKTETVPDALPASSPFVQAGKNNDGEYALEGHTLTVGGQAVTSGGATFSALPSGGGVLVVSNGHTSIISLGEDVDANTSGPDSTHPTPVLLLANPEQPITIGDKTYAAHLTDGSLLVLGSETIRPGFTTVIDGETLLLTGSNLVLATGTSTSTRSLGGYITSSIGSASESGGKETSSSTSESSESSAAAATSEPSSGAGQRSLADMGVLLGGLVSFVFALVLM